MDFKKTLIAACILSTSSYVFADTIYVATNKADGNTIMAFHEDNNAYTKVGEYKTGGKGTGDLEIPALQKDETNPLANGDDPLISAYGVVATNDGRYLLNVNPGDSTVSLLKRNADNSLELVNTQPTGDKFPVSVASYDNKVVVASVGEDNNQGSISAYIIDHGRLKSITNSRRDLKARPSTVMFSSDGSSLIVNELVTGKIHTFGFKDNLSLQPLATIDSPREEDDGRFQAVPVGFAVKAAEKNDYILMSEARFLTPDFKLRDASEEHAGTVQFPNLSWQTSSVSSYRLDKKGQLKLVEEDALTGESVEGGELANCWVALSNDGEYLWTANALSSSISLFEVSDNGKLELLNATAYKNKSEKLFFSDLSVSPDGKTLYQLVGNQGKVLSFDIDKENKLSLQSSMEGLPKLGSYGLVVLDDLKY